MDGIEQDWHIYPHLLKMTVDGEVKISGDGGIRTDRKNTIIPVFIMRPRYRVAFRVALHL